MTGKFDHASLKDKWENSPTAFDMLSALPLAFWTKYYQELCDYTRWILNWTDDKSTPFKDDEPISRFEKKLERLEETLKEKIAAGELSEDAANKKREHDAREIALESIEGAAGIYMIWETQNVKPMDADRDSHADQKREDEKRKGEIERKFIEHLRESIPISEV